MSLWRANDSVFKVHDNEANSIETKGGPTEEKLMFWDAHCVNKQINLNK